MRELTRQSMPAVDEAEFMAQHRATLAELLPLLGPIFGAGVLLFNVWDHFIDPGNAWFSLVVRCALVIAGAPAYRGSALNWSPTQRASHVYLTHVSAIILAEFFLHDGLAYGLAGISACVFPVSIIAVHQRSFFLMLAGPSVLLAGLSLIELPPLGIINTLMLYCFSVGLAYVLMLVVVFFRKRAFLFEKELLHSTRHDGLTGIYNRGYLQELAEREIAAAKRYDRPLAVAMLDIDYFKRINDTYGHAVGDQVIHALACACQTALREIDHFGRIGGEEFACVLPETCEEDARICAERMRSKIEALVVETPYGPISFTISVGVAMLGRRLDNWAALLHAADQAMYGAKNAGRNRVLLQSRIHDEQRPVPPSCTRGRKEESNSRMTPEPDPTKH
jgi:diguanylate cyclase (GGDEF)-like protein